MRSALVVAWLTCAAALARPADAAGSWAATFEAAAVTSHLEGVGWPAQPAILLAAVRSEQQGAAAADPGPAMDALRIALRASGRVPLVMDASALGPLVALDDAAVIERARPFPVDVVGVMRVLPGLDGMTAVCVFYTREGRALGSLRAVEGAALVPRATETGAAAGAPLLAPRDAPGEATPAAGLAKRQRERAEAARNEVARAEYQRRRIAFTRLDGGPGILRWGRPHLGGPDGLLSQGEFYRTVGRPELADLHRRRRIARTTLLTVGGLIVGTGAVTTLTGSVWGIADPLCLQQHTSGSCLLADKSPDGGLVVAGVITTLVGAVLTTAALVFQPRPTTAASDWLMGDDHNRRLRRELNLPDEMHDDGDDSPSRTSRPRTPIARRAD